MSGNKTSEDESKQTPAPVEAPTKRIRPIEFSIPVNNSLKTHSLDESKSYFDVFRRIHGGGGKSVSEIHIRQYWNFLKIAVENPLPNIAFTVRRHNKDIDGPRPHRYTLHYSGHLDFASTYDLKNFKHERFLPSQPDAARLIGIAARERKFKRSRNGRFKSTPGKKAVKKAKSPTTPVDVVNADNPTVTVSSDDNTSAPGTE